MTNQNLINRFISTSICLFQLRQINGLHDIMRFFFLSADFLLILSFVLFIFLLCFILVFSFLHVFLLSFSVSISILFCFIFSFFLFSYLASLYLIFLGDLRSFLPFCFSFVSFLFSLFLPSRIQTRNNGCSTRQKV